MKKLYYLIVLTLILGLVLTGCLLSNVGQVPTSEQSGITYLTKGTEAEPEPFPLYAGQHDLVGQVLVWDDGETLCVKYQLDPAIFAEGWGITETHLAVATSLEGIPTNKSGNPQPGKFPYGNDELGGVVEDGPYCIEFGEDEGQLDVNLDCGETVVIAAHAVIEKCETESFTFNPELTWTRSSELDVAVFPGYGAQWTQVQGFTILTPDVFVWDGGELGQYFTGYSSRTDISWASWICTQNASGKSLTGTDLRRFNATFDMPAGYTVTSGTLGSVNPGYENVIPMNDNIYIFVNEQLLFWGGTISIPILDPGRTDFLGVMRRDTEPQESGTFPETDGWHMDGTFPAIPSGLFLEGPNELDVFAEELWAGGGMHELGLTLQVEQTTCETETAWAANEEIEGEEEGTMQFVDSKSWATYFYYDVEAVPVDTTWILTFKYEDIDYPHDMELTNTCGTLTGTGGYPVGGPYVYPWTITSGSVIGNAINFSAEYDSGCPVGVVGKVMHLTGIIVAPGTTMSGEWTDNVGGPPDRSGTWVAVLVP